MNNRHDNKDNYKAMDLRKAADYLEFHRTMTPERRNQLHGRPPLRQVDDGDHIASSSPPLDAVGVAGRAARRAARKRKLHELRRRCPNREAYEEKLVELMNSNEAWKTFFK